jgi:Zn finger protein HypA/HybF involved in hydrogenase expression
MASLGHGGIDVKVGTWRDPVTTILSFALRSDWKTAMVEGVELVMADITHPVQECRCAGSAHGRNVVGRGGERPSLEGEDRGENWF